jgi:hypothetical protein
VDKAPHQRRGVQILDDRNAKFWQGLNFSWRASLRVAFLGIKVRPARLD